MNIANQNQKTATKDALPGANVPKLPIYLDYQVGCIVEELRKLGQYENSVIIFTSDNGPIITGGAESDFFENASP